MHDDRWPSLMRLPPGLFSAFPGGPEVTSTSPWPATIRQNAKFSCGTAAIRIKTGRHEGLPQNERIYPICENVVEDEYHVLCRCILCTDRERNIMNA